MVEDNRAVEEESKFNMAIATLKRLDKILEEIKQTDYIPLPEDRKQKLKIDLIKQFFIQSAPLLKVTSVEDFQKKILELEPVKVKVYVRDGFSSKENQEMNLKFDAGLDLKLNEILIELQMRLQKEGKYFMPPEDSEGLF